MKTDSYNNQYWLILGEAWNKGIESTNKRTGSKVKTIEGGISFKINMDHGIPTPGHRFFSHKSMAAEFAWIINGTKDPSIVMRHCPGIWKDFVDEKYEVPAAYGYRLRNGLGRDQLRELINHLKEDPSSRQTAVYFADPSKDGLGNKDFVVPNIPCVTTAAFSIVNGKLHCSVFMRSTDIWLGLPFDIFFMSKISYYVAMELGVEMGTMHFTSNNAHIYENQYRFVEKAYKMNLGYVPTEFKWVSERKVSPKYLPVDHEYFEYCESYIDRIKSDPEGYIKAFIKYNETMVKHPWKPKVGPVV